MNRSWTDEDTDHLTKLWNEGCSSGHIAKELGKSRNAVIGKVSRLGLVPRDQAIRNKHAVTGRWGEGYVAQTRPKKKANPFRGDCSARAQCVSIPLPAPPLTPDQKEYILGQGIILLELKPESCRWPINDPPRGGEYLFCGQKNFRSVEVLTGIVLKDCPYCGYHARMAYGRAA